MNGKTDRTDETDVLAKNEQLTTDLGTAKASIATLTKERDTARGEAARVPVLEGELTTAKATIASLTSERDTLKTENASLTAKMSDFDRSVATAVAKLGVSGKGASTPAGGEGKSGDAELLAQYEAVKDDPAKRAEFLQANSEKLRSLLK